MVEQAGELWGQDNKALLQTSDCIIESNVYKCYKIKIKDLISTDYLESESKNEPKYSNPKDNNSMLNMCVYVYKKIIEFIQKILVKMKHAIM